MSEKPEVVPEGGDVVTTNAPAPQISPAIEEILKDIPEPQRERIRHTFREISLTAFQGAVSPRIDAETARIITESLDKDNEHKFQYLTQKQRDEAEVIKRQHDFEVLRHNDNRQMLWPTLICVLILVMGCITAGIYLTANGHEVLGSNLLTSIISGLLAYLAGLGTANFFKDK
jgi:hypothetical protein